MGILPVWISVGWGWIFEDFTAPPEIVSSNIDIINYCRDMFDIKSPYVQVSQRFDVFIAKWV